MQSHFFSLLSLYPKDHFIERTSFHGLSGYFLVNQGDDLDPPKKWIKEWAEQSYGNWVKRKALVEMDKELKGSDLSITILKGMALLGDIYQQDGERSISDIDILVDKSDLEKTFKLLNKLSYKELPMPKWKANDFKYIFEKEVDSHCLVIEVHTHLFYLEKKVSIKWQKNSFSSELNQLEKLAPTDMFLHLCGHLAHQHTFLYLHWLLDIELFYKKYQHQIDFDRLKSLASEIHLNRSCAAILYCLEKYLRVTLSEEAYEYSEEHLPDSLKKLLSFEFLLNPYKNKLKYYKVKHFLKDHFYQSLDYNVNWLRSKISESLLGKR